MRWACRKSGLRAVRPHFSRLLTCETFSGTVKWKSPNKGVVTVDKNGKLTAKGRGTATITASVDKVKKTCKVTVKDTATKAITYGAFTDLDSWNKAVQIAERNAVGLSGSLVTLADGKTYYTGNIIVDRKVLEYKTVDMKVNDMYGPAKSGSASTKTIHLKLPSKVQYKLHRHNLSNKVNSKNVGRLMASLVESNSITRTQECSCGLECVLSWEIPLPDTDDSFDGNTTIQANSIMTVQRPSK